MNKVSWMRAACSDNGSTHSDADADAACRCWPFGGFMYASAPLIPGSQDVPYRPHFRPSLSSRELSALRRPLKIAIKIEIGNKISAGRSPVAERITENYFLVAIFFKKIYRVMCCIPHGVFRSCSMIEANSSSWFYIKLIISDRRIFSL